MPPQTEKPYQLSLQELLKQLNSTTSGLTETEVQNRLKQFGENKLTAKKKVSPFSIFFEQFKNTLTLILIASAFLILFIYFFGEKEQSDLVEAGLILGIVVMIAFLGFFQEYKAEKAIDSLKKMLAFKAKVKRDGKEQEVDVTQLVVGDIVILEEGTKVPADIRLLEVFSLSTSEASLTGESAPVSKLTSNITEDKQVADQKNMVFSGTIVVSGRAIGVVVKTGDRTEIGKIAKDVSEVEDEQTPIQKRLDEIGKMIGYIIIGICAVVFVFITFFAQEFQNQPLLQRVIHSFIASVALAVAAIPEGLPAVVTISLALGTQRMLKKNALIRRLNSVETLGSTDVICSDKTGTLTKGEMTVTQIYFENDLYQLSGTGYETTGGFSVNGKSSDPTKIGLLLQSGLDCNNSNLENGKPMGDPTEVALLVSAFKAGLKTKNERVHEVPFSSERKMMSVVVKTQNGLTLFAKGAPEMILKQSKIADQDGQTVMDQVHNMSSQALRTLAFAYKNVTQEDLKNLENLEQNLIFLGLSGMIDPPRIEVKPLIEQCNQSGIRTIMITGDHLDTAKAVAREIGLQGDALSGDELDKLSEDQFKEVVEKVSIYARVSPNFKMRIVTALQEKGHIVAMTGDGVNDAPALKKADIGIAMGITGTDVAKEASDMVLLDDQFSTIISAIEEGRGIYHNIRKFVTYLLACNIGEVLIVFFGVMFFQKLPLTATMLLWINVVTDGIPAVALGLDPAEKGIIKYSPKLFQMKIIPNRLWWEMFIFGVLMTVGVLGLFTLDLPKGLVFAQAAAFTSIVIFELVDIYIIRSGYKTSFFSNKWLLVAVGITILLQLIIAYTPFLQQVFEIVELNPFNWVLMILISVALWISFKVIHKILDSSHVFNPSS